MYIYHIYGNFSFCKDKGLAPKKKKKKIRMSTNLHHRVLSQAFGFFLGVCY